MTLQDAQPLINKVDQLKIAIKNLEWEIIMLKERMQEHWPVEV